MSKSVFVLLLGSEEDQPADLYQGLQKKDALEKAAATGLEVEVAFAPGFDQFRVLRRRLNGPPVDAVLTEPANASTLKLMLKELKGKTGLVLLNAWESHLEDELGAWGEGLPAGAVSAPQDRIGEIQGRQISAVVPKEGSVLVVTGPSRSSAAQERLEGLRTTIRSDIQVSDTEAGQWTEADGILAFNNWYGLFKSRHEAIHAIAGQSDDVAMGARQASRAVTDPEHARMFGEARVLGAGACPGFGRELVDDGTLHASIVLPPNAGLALDLLQRFWSGGEPLPTRSFTDVNAYPPGSVGDS